MSGKSTRGRSVESRLKDVEHEILVGVASGENLADVMSLMCRRAEEIAPNAICSVLRVDNARRLRPLAAPSLPDAYSQNIDGIEIGPMVGSCGSAAYHGVDVEVVNINTDPRWAPYKQLAQAFGLKACWSSPIKSHDGRVVGTFAFYSRRARRASRIERLIVSRCVHLCAVAIEHWEAQGRVRQLAYTDALTGLGNRALLAERFPDILKRAKALGSEVATFYADLDGFRRLNAERGHKIGDQILVAVADRIRSNFPDADLVARLGADEFFLVTTGRAAEGDFEHTAEALSRSVREPYRLGPDTLLHVGVGIGIARFPLDGTDLDALMGRADAALREVKSSGRPGYAFYTARLDAETRARQAFERDVAAAVGAGQLSLVFQPQADAATCKVKGFEALLRWQHPIHGFVPPSKFIPAAESCGAIEEIGAYVLRRALAEAARWPSHLRVAVNVSPAQIVHADFAALVEQALLETGVAPWRLEIEVTEGLFIRDPDAALETLEKLKGQGVTVAMDDFGTGYSSLSTLRSFPFDRIKIDRSFIVDMVSNHDAAAIVNTIMGLGRAMGRIVVAEGVETAAQLKQLQEQGCNEIQGFLIGKPMPIAYYKDVTTAEYPVQPRTASVSAFGM
ncbi:EAL domain-containing protein [Hyphomicrobium sp. CS1GBMeth3]|uniref:putative bifunctional diguanylate cyclase/phosphodiesterase n=1 Tax=Hyphomicrobium sp. CS1GBMeth3 TaxID=1892845 RepID=UPI0009304F94|nr:EAL domain-containing protein [Hyphomicrobium sp. CS1GBMeth3]